MGHVHEVGLCEVHITKQCSRTVCASVRMLLYRIMLGKFMVPKADLSFIFDVPVSIPNTGVSDILHYFQPIARKYICGTEKRTLFEPRL
jgi:hypothetical protein